MGSRKIAQFDTPPQKGPKTGQKWSKNDPKIGKK